MEKTELKALLGENPGALLKALHENDKSLVLGMLWELAGGEGEEKRLRKAAKKALYLLKSSGTDVEQFKPARKERPKEAPAEKFILASLLSLPDSSGSNLLIIAVSDSAALSHDVFQFLISPVKGIKKFSSERGSKKFIERIKALERELFPIPAEYARFRLNEALALTDRKSISGLESIPALLTTQDVEPFRHPVLDLVPLPLSRIAVPDEETELFSEEELSRLSLFGDEVEEYKRRVQEAQNSRLVVGNMNPEERVALIVESFLRAHFTPQRRLLYSRMLHDVALYFHLHQKDRYARTLVDYARDLSEPGSDLKYHPFVGFLLYREFLYKEKGIADEIP